MRGKLLIVILFIVAVAGVVWLAQKRGALSLPGVPGSTGGPGTSSGDRVTVTFAYSTEKRDWIEAAAESFRSKNRDIELKLVGQGSLEGGAAILEGKLQPTAWTPADSLVMSLLESDWRTKYGTALFATGEDAPAPLVISPLVFVAWEDRAEVLAKLGGGHITWKALHQALSADQGWPAIGGKSEWGFVKFGHTDPTRSNSGLQALVSMTYDYYGRTQVAVADLLDPKYQAWVRTIERGVTRFEHSTGTFMTDMVRFGPSRYDLALVYESLAVSQLENAQGRWGNLKLYYLPTTLWSDHPAAILEAPWVTPEQRKAARTWLQHLRSRPVQEQALRLGFRPADTSVPLKNQDPSNPFNRLGPYGLQLDLPPAAPSPDGAIVRNLLSMWTRIVPR
jgi:Bacterial extracellular solute-binding protein